MHSFPLHSADTAPKASQPLLAAASRAYGFLPNLLRGMATSPALLEGYMTLASIFNKTDLTETERQVILMTSNRLNGCATACPWPHRVPPTRHCKAASSRSRSTARSMKARTFCVARRPSWCTTCTGSGAVSKSGSNSCSAPLRRCPATW